ncbi:MAG: prephenate dehydrogenase/arogenate dehydrogenase family protein [Alicyclobacillus sp.]|nr:prephenate dehydrogenase/arogenate dehydrogenase family protein [Alicyclobacillus sp.]
MNRLVVVGCGLIGTSFAMAVKARCPSVHIDGWEADADHRAAAAETGIFDQIYAVPPTSATYDAGLLAVPIRTAVSLLPKLAVHAHFVGDVCSVKHPICEQAEEIGLRDRFAPMHPMAGKAESGPSVATAALFTGRPWLMVRGWPAAEAFLPWVNATGANVRWLDSAAAHDTAMAAVSHGVHVMSAATMLAADGCAGVWRDVYKALTGPGFADTTRISGSPPGFWGETLVANAPAVQAYLQAAIQHLTALVQALERGDVAAVNERLARAQAAKAAWTMAGIVHDPGQNGL